MHTSPFAPPGGRVELHFSPQFASSLRGPLDGKAAHAELERVWPLLEAAILAYAPTHDLEHVRAKTDTGHAQLWTTPNAALVSEILIWPTGLRELSLWLAGGNLEEILSMQPAYEAWARVKNCKRIGIQFGRPGWARKLKDYRTSGVQMTKDL